MRTILLLIFVLVAELHVVQAQQEANPNNQLNTVKIGASVNGKLPFDTSKMILGGYKGKIAYSFFSKEKFLPSGLSLVDTRTTPISAVSFPLIKPLTSDYRRQTVQTVAFSPNGHYLLIRQGELSSFPYWQMYVLDCETHQATPVKHTAILNYPLVSWSPDGQYLCYIVGGDISGSPYDPLGGYIGPLTLMICDWRAGIEYPVATADNLRGPFSWIAPNTLVYGYLSQDKQRVLESLRRRLAELPKNKTAAASDSTTQIRRSLQEIQPDVFQYSPTSRSNQRVIGNAFRPIVSPDGQHVVYFGSEDVKNPIPLREGWEDFPSGSALVVGRMDGTERVALNVFRSYPRVIWQKDNRHLLTVEEVAADRAQVKQWDTQSGQFRVLADVRVRVNIGSASTPQEPQVVPLRLSDDGKQLLLRVTEISGRDPSGNWNILNYSIRSLDLSSSTVETVVEVNNSSGLDLTGGF